MSSSTLEKLKEKEFIETSSSYIFMNKYADAILYLVISSVIIGSAFLYSDVENFKINYNSIKSHNEKVSFGTYTDLIDSFYLFVLITGAHYLFRYLTVKVFAKILRKTYLDSDEEIMTIYTNKVSTNSFKFFYFLLSTIIGYCVLKDTDFLSKNSLGNGDFLTFVSKGEEHVYGYDKPNGLKFYYNLNLAFVYFETLLLITQPLQSDFLIMVLHHLVTVSLIVFSWVSNNSAVGSFILLVLYYGDVHSTIVRVLIYLDINDLIPAFFTFVFLINFAYTRLYVFAEIVYILCFKLEVTYVSVVYFLNTFLILILLLSVLWQVMITKKFLIWLKTRRIEDIYKIKINKRV